MAEGEPASEAPPFVGPRWTGHLHLLAAIGLGALSAALAGLVLSALPAGASFNPAYGFAGLLVGTGLGACASHSSGAWINTLIVALLMGLLGVLTSAVRAWFPAGVGLYTLEVSVLITLGACTLRRLENLRELDEYILRPRRRTQVALGWTFLEGLGCGGDCGLGAAAMEGPMGLVLIVAVALGFGLLYLIWLWGSRLVEAVQEIGMERLVEEFFLIGAIAAIVPMFFGRFLFAGVLVLVLAALFCVYVPRILSLSGLCMYGLAGLAIGVYPAWLLAHPSPGRWALYGGAAGLAMAGEVWVSDLLSAFGRTCLSAGWRGAALRVFTGLARAHVGGARQRDFALPAARLALELDQPRLAAVHFQSIREFRQAGDAWLAAARRFPRVR